MSKPNEVLTALVTQLKNASGLSYIADEMIMLGIRESVPNFPFICIEPVRMSEADFAYPKERLTFTVMVIGYIRCEDKELQIVGSSETKGIADLENDIKNAIDGDRTLGGYAIHADISTTEYDFVEYPVRSVSITLEILLEQIKATRT